MVAGDGRRARHPRTGLAWGLRTRRVTVRFETAETRPGPVKTFSTDDPDLVPRPRGRYDVPLGTPEAAVPDAGVPEADVPEAEVAAPDDATPL